MAAICREPVLKQGQSADARQTHCTGAPSTVPVTLVEVGGASLSPTVWVRATLQMQIL